jgi:hypothetical protein
MSGRMESSGALPMTDNDDIEQTIRNEPATDPPSGG